MALKTSSFSFIHFDRVYSLLVNSVGYGGLYSSLLEQAQPYSTLNHSNLPTLPILHLIIQFFLPSAAQSFESSYLLLDQLNLSSLRLIIEILQASLPSARSIEYSYPPYPPLDQSNLHILEQREDDLYNRAEGGQFK